MSTVDGAICSSDDFGVLTFNPGSFDFGTYETRMDTPAWYVTDLTELWMPPAQRGSNVIIPGAHGTRPYRRMKTETDVGLPMVISGAVDQFGTPFGNVLEGLRLNLEWLGENVVDPPPDGSATRSATLTSPDGLSLLTADVQVLALDRGSEHLDELVTRAVLHVRIPAGRFAELIS